MAPHPNGGRRPPGSGASIAVVAEPELEADAGELVSGGVADRDRDGLIFLDQLARAAERLVFGAEPLDLHPVVLVPIPVQHGQTIPMEHAIRHDFTPDPEVDLAAVDFSLFKENRHITQLSAPLALSRALKFPGPCKTYQCSTGHKNARSFTASI